MTATMREVGQASSDINTESDNLEKLMKMVEKLTWRNATVKGRFFSGT